MRALDLMKPVLSLVLFLSAGLATAVDDPAAQGIKDATAKIQALIKARRAEFVRDKKAFYAAVDQVVAPVFDVPYIAQITLGKYWRSANADQRTRFQSAFKNTLIHAYSDTLLENSESSQVEWLKTVTDGDNISVQAEVQRRSAQPVALRFELHKAATGGWLAYDISVEGISLITNFRSQFASEVKQKGIDGLIQRLESETAAPAKGA